MASKVGTAEFATRATTGKCFLCGAVARSLTGACPLDDSSPLLHMPWLPTSTEAGKSVITGVGVEFIIDMFKERELWP